MKNQPIRLHPEQETSQKPAWERQKGEPARYFLLFKRYCAMGRKRSLQALWNQERGVQAGTKSRDEKNGGVDTLSTPPVESVSMSGALKRAAAQWKWKERAQAWDIDQLQAREQRLQEYLDYDAEFIKRADRLSLLDVAVGSIVKWIHNEALMEQDPRYFQWAVKQIQSLLRDIRREMAYFEETSRK